MYTKTGLRMQEVTGQRLNGIPIRASSKRTPLVPPTSESGRRAGHTDTRKALASSSPQVARGRGVQRAKISPYSPFEVVAGSRRGRSTGKSSSRPLRKRPDWDGNQKDPSIYRLTTEEAVRRKMLLVSKHNVLLSGQAQSSNIGAVRTTRRRGSKGRRDSPATAAVRDHKNPMIDAVLKEVQLQQKSLISESPSSSDVTMNAGAGGGRNDTNDVGPDDVTTSDFLILAGRSEEVDVDISGMARENGHYLSGIEMEIEAFRDHVRHLEGGLLVTSPGGRGGGIGGECSDNEGKGNLAEAETNKENKGTCISSNKSGNGPHKEVIASPGTNCKSSRPKFGNKVVTNECVTTTTSMGHHITTRDANHELDRESWSKKANPWGSVVDDRQEQSILQDHEAGANLEEGGAVGRRVMGDEKQQPITVGLEGLVNAIALHLGYPPSSIPITPVHMPMETRPIGHKGHESPGMEHGLGRHSEGESVKGGEAYTAEEGGVHSTKGGTVVATLLRFTLELLQRADGAERRVHELTEELESVRRLMKTQKQEGGLGGESGFSGVGSGGTPLLIARGACLGKKEDSPNVTGGAMEASTSMWVSDEVSYNEHLSVLKNKEANMGGISTVREPLQTPPCEKTGSMLSTPARVGDPIENTPSPRRQTSSPLLECDGGGDAELGRTTTSTLQGVVGGAKGQKKSLAMTAGYGAIVPLSQSEERATDQDLWGEALDAVSRLVITGNEPHQLSAPESNHTMSVKETVAQSLVPTLSPRHIEAYTPPHAIHSEGRGIRFEAGGRLTSATDKCSLRPRVRDWTDGSDGSDGQWVQDGLCEESPRVEETPPSAGKEVSPTPESLHHAGWAVVTHAVTPDAKPRCSIDEGKSLGGNSPNSGGGCETGEWGFGNVGEGVVRSVVNGDHKSERCRGRPDINAIGPARLGDDGWGTALGVRSQDPPFKQKGGVTTPSRTSRSSFEPLQQCLASGLQSVLPTVKQSWATDHNGGMPPSTSTTLTTPATARGTVGGEVRCDSLEGPALGRVAVTAATAVPAASIALNTAPTPSKKPVHPFRRHSALVREEPLQRHQWQPSHGTVIVGEERTGGFGNSWFPPPNYCNSIGLSGGDGDWGGGARGDLGGNGEESDGDVANWCTPSPPRSPQFFIGGVKGLIETPRDLTNTERTATVVTAGVTCVDKRTLGPRHLIRQGGGVEEMVRCGNGLVQTTSPMVAVPPALGEWYTPPPV